MAVSNMSDYRCMSYCRSRGHNFDPSLVRNFVETDHEKISMVIFLHSADLFKKDYCVNFMHEVLVNCLFKLAQ